MNENDPMLEKKIDDLRTELHDSLGAIRLDVEARHKQNRESIHTLRNQVQTMVNSQSEVNIRLAPFLGTADTDGLFKTMVNDVKVIKTKQAERVGAERANQRGWFWFRWVIGILLTIFLVIMTFLSLLKAERQGYLRSSDDDTFLAHKYEQSEIPPLR